MFATSIFITIEGTDGSGKTQQTRNIYDYLVSRGIDTVALREPGGDALSEQIRELLINGKNHISDMAECLLFAAARAQTVQNVIRPALDSGKAVVCDRFLDSSVAYQGFGKNLLDAVCVVNSFAVNGLTPRLTILLDMDPSEALGRRDGRDRMERNTRDFFQRVRLGYLELARMEPERFVTIDASLQPDDVWLAIREKIDAVLPLNPGSAFKELPALSDIHSERIVAPREDVCRRKTKTGE